EAESNPGRFTPRRFTPTVKNLTQPRHSGRDGVLGGCVALSPGLGRGAITNCGMAANPVIKDLDIVGYCPCLTETTGAWPGVVLSVRIHHIRCASSKSTVKVYFQGSRARRTW